mmetsp:Transcript_21124/g.54910  ORF Transcript_21124/g.54910 Transcript_21124/m.54910 type:complete len:81 (-) Transcript_21124:260-502(-)
MAFSRSGSLAVGVGETWSSSSLPALPLMAHDGLTSLKNGIDFDHYGRAQLVLCVHVHERTHLHAIFYACDGTKYVVRGAM